MIPFFRSLPSARLEGPYAFSIEQNDPYISDELIWTITHRDTKEAIAYSLNAFSGNEYQDRFTEDAMRIVDALNASHGRNATIGSPVRSMQKRFKPRFAYGQDGVGVDDIWIIWDRWTHRDLASRVFWDCSAEWMNDSEQDMRRIVDALNAGVSLASFLCHHGAALFSSLFRQLRGFGSRPPLSAE